MSRFRIITKEFHASPQIDGEIAAQLKAEGYEVLVCNRPDGEMAGQPDAEELQAVAEASGLEFHHIPVSMPNISPDMADAMHAATHGRKTLAYCASGTRSTLLWLIGAVRNNTMDLEDALDAARSAGYDLEGARPLIASVKGR